MRKLLKRSEGFTLIELMIVILIIAILVAIAVPVYLNARRNAQARTCQANLRTIEGGINQAAAQDDEGLYPVTWADFVATGVIKDAADLDCPSSGDSYGQGWTPSPDGGETPPRVECPTDPRPPNHEI